MRNKKFIFIPILILAIAAVILFAHRYRILRYSVEALIRNNLPAYITIDKMSFDLKSGRAVFSGLKITNPEGFSYKFLLEVEEASCRYRMRGSTIFQGIEILDPVFANGSMGVERLPDRRVNLAEMQNIMAGPPGEDLRQKPPEASEAKREAARGKSREAAPGNVKLSDFVKLPEEFLLKNGKVTFIDGTVSSRPYVITLDNIDAKFLLQLDDSYSRVLRFSSAGSAYINGNADETVIWVVNLNPTTPALTMSNRFEVSGANIITFEPYYRRYSPFIFKRGAFSGTLVFDFDNGNIGSTNVIRLSDLVFSVKPGYENAAFWQTTVPDMVKYFTSPYGEIVFDFKIKGEMANPQFYLGPISKRALASMAIDKISTAIQDASQGGAKAGKMKDYIDLFSAFANKK